MCKLFLAFLTYCVMLVCFAYAAHAQPGGNRNAPHKFDEFKIDYYTPGVDVAARLRRFAQQLKREPRTKAYVIAYSPRVFDRRGSDYWSIAENRLGTTKAELSGKYGVVESRISGIDGGVREDTTVELWLLPPGSTPPQPRAEFSTKDVVQCCVIRASGELYQYKKDKPLTFTAALALGACPQISEFHWSTSSGKIISGQGTSAIQVDASTTTDRAVRATVEARGMSMDCISTDSVQTVLGIAPYRLFEFEEERSESIEARAEYLAHYLTQEPELRGYIVVYGGRARPHHLAASRADFTRDYLINSRGIAPDRFSIVMGGYRENPMFEYWLVPQGTVPPSPSPWVDERYVDSRPPPKAVRRKS